MGFFHYTFSDMYARRDNWLTMLDVRVKLFYIISLLTVNLFAKNIAIPLLSLLISFPLLLSIRVPLAALLRNMMLPVFFATFILLIKSLHEGETEWISFSCMGYSIVLKEEGLRSGFLVFSKVLGGVSLVMLLSFTTTISRLCTGLKWFRIPNTLIELLAFIYRYIFLLLDEVSTMWIAQKSRLGHSSWKRTIKSSGTLGGSLIIRAFERAERTHDSMRARCYEGGDIMMAALPPWRKKEYLFIAGIIFMMPVLIYTGSINAW